MSDKYELSIHGDCYLDHNVGLRTFADHRQFWHGSIDELCETVLECNRLKGNYASVLDYINTLARETSVAECEYGDDPRDGIMRIVDRLHGRLSKKHGELDELQAIVDQLPKTADGVVLIPDIFVTLYAIWEDAIVEITAAPESYGDGWWVDDGDFDSPVSAMYSTREAAEAAMQQKEGV